MYPRRVGTAAFRNRHKNNIAYALWIESIMTYRKKYKDLEYGGGFADKSEGI